LSDADGLISLQATKKGFLTSDIFKEKKRIYAATMRIAREELKFF
jgi:hypothetical protein